MAQSVRDLVTAIQAEIRDEDVLPARAAQLLTRLTALLGNIQTEIREADHAYAVVLLQHLESEEAAARAKIRAETSPEYMRRQSARHLLKLAEQMIGSLKYLLKTAEAEMRLAR